MALALLGGTLALVVPPAPPATAQSRPPLYVMADSVVLGADGALRTTMPEFQVNMNGFPAIFPRVAAALVPQHAHLIGDVAVVAVGHNYSYWDPARFDRAIDAMVTNLNAAGAEHVIWVTLRHATHANSPPSSWWQVDRYAWYFPTVNAHLRRAVDRHPSLSLADWAAVSTGLGLTYDSIHLNSAGQRAMAELIRDTIAAAKARSSAGTVVPMRTAATGPVPGDSRGVTVQVELSNARRAGAVRLYACGTSPGAGHVLSVPGVGRVTHEVFVRLTRTGSVCLRLDESMEASMAVLAHAPRGSPVANPATVLLDERRVAPGDTVVVPVDGDGRRRGAVMLQVHGRSEGARATYTVYPCDQRPLWATPLRATAAGRAEQALVRPGTDGTVCVRARRPVTVAIRQLGTVANRAQLRARRPVAVLSVPPTDPLISGARAVVDVAQHPALPEQPNTLYLFLRVTAALTAGTVELADCTRPDGPPVGWRFEEVGATAVLPVVAGGQGRVCIRSDVPVALDAFVVGWSEKKPALSPTGGQPHT